LISPLKYNKNNLDELGYFLKCNVHSDFYLTEDNKRVFITDHNSYRKILKQSHSVLVSREASSVDGVIMLWKGTGGAKQRCYLKINAKDMKIADKLLTVLLWDCNKNIYVKIKKHSPYLKIFREKRFSFAGGRGRELLLVYRKREKTYVNNFNKYNYKSKIPAG